MDCEGLLDLLVEDDSSIELSFPRETRGSGAAAYLWKEE